MSSQAEPTMIRAVFFRDGNFWVVQCLEYDIATHSEDFFGLQERLKQALRAEEVFSAENGLTAFKRLPKAPSKYWQMWERATEAQPEDELESAPDRPWGCLTVPAFLLGASGGSGSRPWS